MTNTDFFVPVRISDLQKMAKLISDADYRDIAPSIELINKMHELVKKMARGHGDIYPDDEQKPNLRLVVSNDRAPAVH